jgi:hypothetical protein
VGKPTSIETGLANDDAASVAHDLDLTAQGRKGENELRRLRRLACHPRCGESLRSAADCPHDRREDWPGVPHLAIAVEERIEIQTGHQAGMDERHAKRYGIGRLASSQSVKLCRAGATD